MELFRFHLQVRSCSVVCVTGLFHLAQCPLVPLSHHKQQNLLSEGCMISHCVSAVGSSAGAHVEVQICLQQQQFQFLWLCSQRYGYCTMMIVKITSLQVNSSGKLYFEHNVYALIFHLESHKPQEWESTPPPNLWPHMSSQTPLVLSILLLF